MAESKAREWLEKAPTDGISRVAHNVVKPAIEELVDRVERLEEQVGEARDLLTLTRRRLDSTQDDVEGTGERIVHGEEEMLARLEALERQVGERKPDAVGRGFVLHTERGATIDAIVERLNMDPEKTSLFMQDVRDVAARVGISGRVDPEGSTPSDSESSEPPAEVPSEPEGKVAKMFSIDPYLRGFKAGVESISLPPEEAGEWEASWLYTRITKMHYWELARAHRAMHKLHSTKRGRLEHYPGTGWIFSDGKGGIHDYFRTPTDAILGEELEPPKLRPLTEEQREKLWPDVDPKDIPPTARTWTVNDPAQRHMNEPSRIEVPPEIAEGPGLVVPDPLHISAFDERLATPEQAAMMTPDPSGAADEFFASQPNPHEPDGTATTAKAAYDALMTDTTTSALWAEQGDPATWVEARATRDAHQQRGDEK